MDEVQITIIGAGAIGLSTAAKLSKVYDDVVVLEKNSGFGQETSSRNSEVIHAGIYYPPGSLKAELCVEGARLLYDYCEKNNIAFRRLGKLIVASTESEVPEIERLKANGVDGLRILDGKEVASLEPAVMSRAALFSPNTGIFDTHGFMKKLYDEAILNGAVFSFDSEVVYIDKHDGFYIVGVAAEDYRFRTRVLINSAGLSSDAIARLAGIDIDGSGYRLEYIKGSYFSYSKKSPVGMLVYPLPNRDGKGLGIHATLDLGGRLRFGPDAEPVTDVDYTVDVQKRRVFYESACGIIRGLEESCFVPDMSGIRPRLKNEGVRDFIIEHEAPRGLPGLINLVGIESPGLTASLSIASKVELLVREAF